MVIAIAVIITIINNHHSPKMLRLGFGPGSSFRAAGCCHRCQRCRRCHWPSPPCDEPMGLAGNASNVWGKSMKILEKIAVLHRLSIKNLALTSKHVDL